MGRAVKKKSKAKIEESDWLENLIVAGLGCIAIFVIFSIGMGVGERRARKSRHIRTFETVDRYCIEMDGEVTCVGKQPPAELDISHLYDRRKDLRT
jgi:hypothetical protein